MKNKILYAPLALLLITLNVFISCGDDDEYKEVAVTAVQNLYTPEEDKPLKLNVDASAYFEWEKAVAADNGVVYYDVLFDTENGDFSNPVYVIVADNKGTSTGATITHKVLNRIANLAGIGIGETGTIKWTVRSSRGLTYTMPTVNHKLTLTRLSGFDAPAVLYLTGEGAENGGDLSKAQSFIASEDQFEIFTELIAGKEFYYMTDKEPADALYYYSTADALRENETNYTVAETGVYRIHLDFTAGTSSIQKVDKVDFFMCTPEKRQEMIYQGNGIWKSGDFKPDFRTNWGDDRYFYYMNIEGTQYKLASKNKDNQAPSSLSGTYFDIGYFGLDDNRWDYSFKFPGEMRNAAEGTVIVDMVLYLNNSKYTNEIIKRY